MNIGELLIQLGFKADTMKLKDFIHSVGELNMQSIIAATGFGGLYEAAKRAIEAAEEMAEPLHAFSVQTGQSTDRLQQFSQAAEEMGASSGTVESAIRTLQQSIFRMRMTGEGSNVWGMLGIDPTQVQDKFEILNQLRERFKGMSVEARQFYLSQLGISQDMLNLFAMSDEGWADISNNMVMSHDQLEKMAEFHKINVRLSRDLKMIWVSLGVMIAPFVTKLAEGADWLNRIVLKSWAWKGSLDAISETLMRIINGWWMIAKFGVMAVKDPLATADGLIQSGVDTVKGAIMGVNHAIYHNTFHIKSTDPVQAGREAEAQFKRSVGSSYFSKSKGEH